MPAKNLSTLFQECERRFFDARIYNPAKEAERIFSITADGLSRGDLGIDDILRIIDRRARREPLARILGATTFRGLNIFVEPHVFRPYPESEAIVEHVLDHLRDHAQPLSILDLGSGSGCLGLALLDALPNATALGIDNNPNAIRLSLRNADHLRQTRYTASRGDWLEDIQQRFDVIICWPPSVPTRDVPRLAREMRDHDPVAALDGGPDGTDFYRRAAARLGAVLAADGLAVFQTPYSLAQRAAEQFQAQSLNAQLLRNYLGLPNGVLIKHGETA